jgi:hypothetical protein
MNQDQDLRDWADKETEETIAKHKCPHILVTSTLDP